MTDRHLPSAVSHSEGARPAHSAAPPAEDWRDRLLAAVARRPPAPPAPNRLRWPGYTGGAAVWWGDGPVAGTHCVVAAWEFGVYGGSFGEVDAATFALAARHAATTGLSLVSFLRSGGTRLQEGVAGLVGLARATLATAELDEAGVPHLAVVDHPTTGGVWVTIASSADLRCAVAAATVGFAGPRVVSAVTGSAPGAGSHTAESALAAGLVDAAVQPDRVEAWLATALAAAVGKPTAPSATPPATRSVGNAPSDASALNPTIAPNGPIAPDGGLETDNAVPLTGAIVQGARVAPDDGDAPDGRSGQRARTGPVRSGWEQVRAARAAGRASAGAALDALLTSGVELAGGDPTVRVRLGLLSRPGAVTASSGVVGPAGTAASGALAAPGGVAGHGVVAVALGAWPGAAPRPAGFRLLTRAAQVAGKLGLPLVTFVDTPGADPSLAAEAGGIAAAIGAAMSALLICPSPTVCVVVGEGGSGGALAGACADVLLMAPDSYLTALAPEGAAATLRIPADQAADLGAPRPADLRRLGFADGVLDRAEPASLAAAAAAALTTLTATDQAVRLSARRRKWSTALPGSL